MGLQLERDHPGGARRRRFGDPQGQRDGLCIVCPHEGPRLRDGLEELRHGEVHLVGVESLTDGLAARGFAGGGDEVGVAAAEVREEELNVDDLARPPEETGVRGQGQSEGRV